MTVNEVLEEVREQFEDLFNEFNGVPPESSLRQAIEDVAGCNTPLYVEVVRTVEEAGKKYRPGHYSFSVLLFRHHHAFRRFTFFHPIP